MRRYLYRGVNDDQHVRGIGLEPRNRELFSAPALADEAQFDVHTWDSSPTNAAIDHTRGRKLSGVSATSSKRVAERFAANDGKGGWVYTFAVSRLRCHGIQQIDMAEILPATDSTYADREVILVAEPPGPIDHATLVCVERYLP